MEKYKPEPVKRQRQSDDVKPKGKADAHPEVISAQVRDVLQMLLVFRFINAVCVRTFFQPDEYFQALEPAWSIAFGAESGAWLTWEWEHQLRSSLHPAIFGVAYKAFRGLMSFLVLPPPFQSFALVALPKLVQSGFAALGDFYTWRLATEIFGRRSNSPWAALWMTVLNPWQWYCSTRTFSNSLETTLTIAALHYWPWELLKDAIASKNVPLQSSSSVNSLRLSLFLAAIAVLLRPTNLFIWFGILTLTLTRFTLDGKSSLQKTQLVVLTREIIVCGLLALAISAASDRLYFGFWAFPPYKWLYFNISQSLAVFYGRMPWHYYLLQGIPLLTTTFLPFTLIGLYKSISPSKSVPTLQANVLRTLSFTVLTMVGALSSVSHKEVRFIYPLLPILHILGAPLMTDFFTDKTSTSTSSKKASSFQPVTLRHKLSLANIISINILLGGYLSFFHQGATISVLDFLRTDFERLHPDALALGSTANMTAVHLEEDLFVLFLTPCHSTPWRSHLVYPALFARALTCEPPLDTAPGSLERATYLDEADRFYAKDDDDRNGRYGVKFMNEELWPVLAVGGNNKKKTRGGGVPRYIVGFEGIGEMLNEFFEGEEGRDMDVKLRKVWEGWNGAFNEDWRRRGRLVVWDTGVYGEEKR
ncbi:Alg9-like mannosyltransferase family-domain-containing protein [Apodospora peruviana]|uniref:Mannosyltransferase n=1 Tax=Apodospora peruviana TaxID=516989 RepID=A0AAE0HVR8_9PEZI|nr:Alg9-like mannosyltransferase family-domain-containing protein [Apodospora peruviana]